MYLLFSLISKAERIEDKTNDEQHSHRQLIVYRLRFYSMMIAESGGEVGKALQSMGTPEGEYCYERYKERNKKFLKIRE